MSTINTNSIDANYPVPGQNNSTQGFRNNFAAIKQNLNIASTEITDLQNKVVLKSALANSTINNDMANTLISNATTLGFRASTYNLGNALTDTVTVDLSLGDVQYGNLAGNIFLNFGSWAPTGTVSNVTLQLGRPNAESDFSIIFPTEALYTDNYGWSLVENSALANGLATLTFPHNATQLNLLISTIDCGNTLYVQPINRPFQTNQIQKRTPPPTGQLGDVIGTMSVDDDQAIQIPIVSSTVSSNVAPSYLVTSDTSGLYSGKPIVFTDVSFEPNIVIGATYYVGNVANSTHFSVSTNANASGNISLSGSTGLMYCNPVNYLYVAVDNYNADTYSKSVGSTTAPNTISISSTLGNVAVNLPIIFTGSGAANANVELGKVYYIKSLSGSDITVSETIDNGIAGPTYEFISNTFGGFDFTVYDGYDIFRKIPLLPGTEVATSIAAPSLDNVRIGGGVNGYFLQTDGTGNLAWSAASGGGGNGSPGGSNTQVQFNDAGSFGAVAGFTFDSSSNTLSVPGNIVTVSTVTSFGVQSNTGTFTGNISAANANLGLVAIANFFVGSGNNLSNIAGANVSGIVANANYAAFAGNLSSNGNVSVGNVLASGIIDANGNVIGGNLVTNGNLSVTGLATVGNLAVTGSVAATVVGAVTLVSTGDTNVGGIANVVGNIISDSNIAANNYFISSINTSLTSFGTSQTDALQLSKSINVVTSVSSGTGVKLPATVILGARIIVRNSGSNPLNVYPGLGNQINSLGTNNPYVLAAAGSIELFGGGANQWFTI